MSIKKMIYGIMLGLVLLSVFNTGVMFVLLNQNQSNGKIVNYVGVVRGATQRVVKMRLLHQPIDGLVINVEKAMEGIISGSEELGLPTPKDQALVAQMKEIRTYWKEQVYSLLLQEQVDEQNLLANSEELFNKSNLAVGQAEAHSAQGIVLLKLVSVITMLVNFVSFGFVLFVIRKQILKPVNSLEEGMDSFSKGNLSVQLAYDSKNELGMLANSMRTSIETLSQYISQIGQAMSQMERGDFDLYVPEYIGDFKQIGQSIDQFSTKISETLSQLNQTSLQVSTGADHVAMSSQLLSEGAVEQSSAIEELSHAVAMIVEKIDETARHTSHFNQKATQMGKSIDESEQQMQVLLQAMDDIQKNSEEIIKINRTIEDIAFQTNILALNAAVEAARAGVSGKGFAVVADEVRNLAAKSADAASHTSTLIDITVRSVSSGKNLTDSMAKSLNGVLLDAREIAQGVKEIQQASLEQTNSISHITKSVDLISGVVQTNSATAEESAAASEELSAQAKLLSNLASQFTLKHDVNQGY